MRPMEPAPGWSVLLSRLRADYSNGELGRWRFQCICNDDLAGWSHPQGLKLARQLRKLLSLQSRIADLKAVPFTQQEFAAFEHPEIRGSIRHCPKPLRLNRSIGQFQNDRFHLAVRRGLSRLALKEPWRAKTEQHPILVKKIESHEAIVTAQVGEARRTVAQ